jgi:hypothetical protein
VTQAGDVLGTWCETQPLTRELAPVLLGTAAGGTPVLLDRAVWVETGTGASNQRGQMEIFAVALALFISLSWANALADVKRNCDPVNFPNRIFNATQFPVSRIKIGQEGNKKTYQFKGVILNDELPHSIPALLYVPTSASQLTKCAIVKVSSTPASRGIDEGKFVEETINKHRCAASGQTCKVNVDTDLWSRYIRRLVETGIRSGFDMVPADPVLRGFAIIRGSEEPVLLAWGRKYSDGQGYANVRLEKSEVEIIQSYEVLEEMSQRINNIFHSVEVQNDR